VGPGRASLIFEDIFAAWGDLELGVVTLAVLGCVLKVTTKKSCQLF